MTQVDAAKTASAGAGVWIFRVLVVAAAAFMVYSWFQPWWTADIAVIKGDNDLVLHPWGIEAVAQVRANADDSLYAMPGFFAPFMWAYLVVCMLALAASLVVTRTISLGRIKLPVATVLILVVGLSYLIAALLAHQIGELRASAAGTNFIGRSTFVEPESGAKLKMVSDLAGGYWLALYAGAAVFVVGIISWPFARKLKA